MNNGLVYVTIPFSTANCACTNNMYNNNEHFKTFVYKKCVKHFCFSIKNENIFTWIFLNWNYFDLKKLDLRYVLFVLTKWTWITECYSDNCQLWSNTICMGILDSSYWKVQLQAELSWQSPSILPSHDAIDKSS